MFEPFFWITAATRRSIDWINLWVMYTWIWNKSAITHDTACVWNWNMCSSINASQQRPLCWKVICKYLIWNLLTISIGNYFNTTAVIPRLLDVNCFSFRFPNIRFTVLCNIPANSANTSPHCTFYIPKPITPFCQSQI